MGTSDDYKPTLRFPSSDLIGLYANLELDLRSRIHRFNTCECGGPNVRSVSS